jgi:hypothetical protein
MTWNRCSPICDIILLFIHKGKKLNKKTGWSIWTRIFPNMYYWIEMFGEFWYQRCWSLGFVYFVDTKRRVMTWVWVCRTFWLAVDCPSNQTFKFLDSTSSGKNWIWKKYNSCVWMLSWTFFTLLCWRTVETPENNRLALNWISFCVASYFPKSV